MNKSLKNNLSLEEAFHYIDELTTEEFKGIYEKARDGRDEYERGYDNGRETSHTNCLDEDTVVIEYYTAKEEGYKEGYYDGWFGLDRDEK